MVMVSGKVKTRFKHTSTRGATTFQEALMAPYRVHFSLWRGDPLAIHPVS
jgi:hypothetical protein